ncbi:hypothetical protein CWR40_004404 [Cronobacter sakazakii]|uniref:hypothetical protein n=1 Tax=Cronobacter sakazakii TaxID=28141 RepID=UPI00029C3C9D|nr:hypothetical protein [Cronobacter sakazakii]CCK14014.1 hypothetical protein BN126_4217 [Cronobacter sakazakii 680]AKE95411.1 hypothetical protein CSK29544_02454 [Cronobacter sakazakii]AXW97057.2 hypothetical protein CsakCS931_23105 [Cronobacter sakazakii]EGT4268447.1 hypothetical protein [Cronobacter sakazakii]EGT4283950.1 hypothetical protein [Cronobacter sakazakii]
MPISLLILKPMVMALSPKITLQHRINLSEPMKSPANEDGGLLFRIVTFSDVAQTGTQPIF